MTSLESVRYEKDGHIATVTFNRPQVMNALHPLLEAAHRHSQRRCRGLEPALRCHPILATDHARLGLPEVRRGLLADAEGAISILDAG